MIFKLTYIHFFNFFVTFLESVLSLDKISSGPRRFICYYKIFYHGICDDVKNDLHRPKTSILILIIFISITFIFITVISITAIIFISIRLRFRLVPSQYCFASMFLSWTTSVYFVNH